MLVPCGLRRLHARAEHVTFRNGWVVETWREQNGKHVGGCATGTENPKSRTEISAGRLVDFGVGTYRRGVVGLVAWG